ncbi:uncharacterized protein LOC114727289 [Neltuma alba]|uniref:uncharacterized protein LOC114727289 n=1 Tax=Neltuma alba TaxID=207710 RepID=UPI0010A3623C|nr:uncharacterized protein LOC114727289 [Prosopis alba]
MPSTTVPDWFNECCKGGTLSFRARGHFPHAAFAFELGKANTNSKHFFHVSVSINGHKTQRRQDAANYGTRQGHLFLFDLRMAFEPGEWERLDSLLELDWNDVEIKVLCLIPRKKKKVTKLTAEMPVVSCGVYVYKRQTNMENVQFGSSMLSSNAPTTSMKQRAVTSPPNEPPKKLLRMFKVADKGKLNNTETDKEN